MTLKYLRLAPESGLPHLTEGSAFRAIIIADSQTSSAWRGKVSQWLAATECCYLQAWGVACEQWHDAMDDAIVSYDKSFADKLVITTWHADETLEDVFWFAKHCASHPVHTLQCTLLIHVAETDKREELRLAYAAA